MGAADVPIEVIEFCSYRRVMQICKGSYSGSYQNIMTHGSCGPVLLDRCIILQNGLLREVLRYHD